MSTMHRITIKPKLFIFTFEYKYLMKNFSKLCSEKNQILAKSEHGSDRIKEFCLLYQQSTKICKKTELFHIVKALESPIVVKEEQHP